jgi:hypothetical protein
MHSLSNCALLNRHIASVSCIAMCQLYWEAAAAQGHVTPMCLLAGQLMFLHTNFVPKMNLQLPLSIEAYTRHDMAGACTLFDEVPRATK